MKKTISIFLVCFAGLSASASTTHQTLVTLLESMPGSYTYRSVCVSGNSVIGSYSTGKSWAENGKTYTTYGTINKFPQKQVEFNPRFSNPIPFSLDYPTGPKDWGRFPVLKERAKDTGDKIYATNGTMPVGNKTVAALCAFESGPRLE
jgi:hypothetical protein